MNINYVKNYIKNLGDKKYHFKYNGNRNQIDEFDGKIVNIYSSIFIVLDLDSNIIRSFSYSDFLIKRLLINQA